MRKQHFHLDRMVAFYFIKQLSSFFGRQNEVLKVGNSFFASEETDKFSYIFEDFPLNLKQCAMYDKKLCKNSVVYHHINEDLPVILTYVINNILEKRNIIPKTRKTEQSNLKCIIQKLSELKNALVTNKHLEPFEIDCSDYRDVFYEMLRNTDAYGWYNANWILVDCYFYWILHTIFEDSSYGSFDPFFEDKLKFGSKLNDGGLLYASVTSLSSVISDVENLNVSKLEATFKLMLKCSLWANRFEKEMRQNNENNFLDAVNNWSNDILIDHCNDVWSLLLAASRKNSKPAACITLVTDNAGFELFCDMCLATFLLKANLSQRVCFHTKIIAWHSSAATWDMYFEHVHTLYKSNEVENLVREWNEYFRTGQFYVVREPFWSLPYTFTDISEKFPSLHKHLAEAAFVILKGNYNYYKLIDDRIVHPITSRISNILPSNVRDIRFLLIRLLKTDLVTDIPSYVFKRLRDQNRKWMQCEEYGIIQFCNFDGR